MKLLASAMHYDNLFLLSIFQLNEKLIISKLLPPISHSANGYYYLLIPALLYFFSPDMAPHFTIAALISFAFELPLCTIIKYGIKRNRPFEILDAIYYRRSPGDRFSLPSGHTSAAFVISVLISYFYPVLLLPSVVWASLVGISRIYLGVHYPSDVLAGTGIGILTGLAGIALSGCFFQVLS